MRDGAARHRPAAPADVDGIVRLHPAAGASQSALGIPEVTWFANPQIPFVNQLVAAVGAVAAASATWCSRTTRAYRMPVFTRRPLATRSAAVGSARRVRGGGGPAPETISGAVGYTAWASRYMHEYGAKREHFGYVAVNDRTNAAATRPRPCASRSRWTTTSRRAMIR